MDDLRYREIDFSVCVDDQQGRQIDLRVRADSYLPVCVQSGNNFWRCISATPGKQWVKVTVGEPEEHVSKSMVNLWDWPVLCS